MTLVERIASAIAASRTGTIEGWQAYCSEARQIIETSKALTAVRESGSTELRRGSNDK